MLYYGALDLPKWCFCALVKWADLTCQQFYASQKINVNA